MLVHPRFIGQDKKQLPTCDVKLRALGTGGVAEGRGPCDDGCPNGSGREAGKIMGPKSLKKLS